MRHARSIRLPQLPSLVYCLFSDISLLPQQSLLHPASRTYSQNSVVQLHVIKSSDPSVLQSLQSSRRFSLACGAPVKPQVANLTTQGHRPHSTLADGPGNSAAGPWLRHPSEEKGVPPIEKVLIANRGEIACRVIRTAKRLGVRTVAVYSDADKDSLHVKLADEAVRIGPPPSNQSYLQGAKILEAALRTGAQAVHPGYGFLSENARFAELCTEAGIEFIGPPPAAIRAMGDKSASKAIMTSAGVPCVPGYHGEDQSPARLAAEAAAVGFPVLIKATAGGGGKGMRIVAEPGEFAEALAGAQREARAAFGDERVLVERYLQKPRHIEVQVFADKHGNAVHLFERDCSVQRRHQKVIEEAPAPGISPEFRQRIGQAAVDTAKAVQYVNAGTVEFIVDTITGEFFFMEMNTRLQVEHPVTEMVTGQDLVEWQLRVAAGEPLPLPPAGLALHGHAFEARVYAENVPRGFLPAAGRLMYCRTPQESSTVRVESGVRQGDAVSVFYDPMIAKLVAWGPDRGKALLKLRQALAEYQIAGLPTNLPFLQQLAAHPAFVAGEVDTGFIERHKEALLAGPAATQPQPLSAPPVAAAVAAAAICLQDRWQQEAQQPGPGAHVWSSGSGLRLNHSLRRVLLLRSAAEGVSSGGGGGAAAAGGGDDGPPPVVQVEVEYDRDGSFLVQLLGDGGSPPLRVSGHPTPGEEDGTRLSVEVDGLATTATLAQFQQAGTHHVHLWLAGCHHHFTRPEPGFVEKLEEAHSEEAGAGHVLGGGGGRGAAAVRGGVVTPMAGRVVKLSVAEGAVVKRGDPVLAIEAMKMEHVVRAPRAGRVERLLVAVGQQVEDGTSLFVVAPLEAEGEPPGPATPTAAAPPAAAVA